MNASHFLGHIECAFEVQNICLRFALPWTCLYICLVSSIISASHSPTKHVNYSLTTKRCVQPDFLIMAIKNHYRLSLSLNLDKFSLQLFVHLCSYSFIYLLTQHSYWHDLSDIPTFKEKKKRQNHMAFHKNHSLVRQTDKCNSENLTNVLNAYMGLHNLIQISLEVQK